MVIRSQAEEHGLRLYTSNEDLGLTGDREFAGGSIDRLLQLIDSCSEISVVLVPEGDPIYHFAGEESTLPEIIDHVHSLRNLPHGAEEGVERRLHEIAARVFNQTGVVHG